ncbi:hypothetical protein LSF60_19190 [Rhodococcus pyridinivorans]|nr:hypothetical protein [Rhodococcus pyridinivorans]UGQ60276.1 hypothetical protein LSF60_19190 [Rhodococcus pyridinivorans]
MREDDCERPAAGHCLARTRQDARRPERLCHQPSCLLMDPREIIGKYHELWHVEQSFRMSKTDLRARPIFHRTRDAIEAHLTVVFAALAVSRVVQERSDLAIGKVVKLLRPLRSATIAINGTRHTFPPQVEADMQVLLDRISGTEITH